MSLVVALQDEALLLSCGTNLISTLISLSTCIKSSNNLFSLIRRLPCKSLMGPSPNLRSARCWCQLQICLRKWELSALAKEKVALSSPRVRFTAAYGFCCWNTVISCRPIKSTCLYCTEKYIYAHRITAFLAKHSSKIRIFRKMLILSKYLRPQFAVLHGSYFASVKLKRQYVT